MPVPDFDHNGVLPPHLGMPTERTQLSPYPAVSLEICAKLGTSPERRTILRGWLGLRTALRSLGFATGFQWVVGSFLEDCASDRKFVQSLELPLKDARFCADGSVSGQHSGRLDSRPVSSGWLEVFWKTVNPIGNLCKAWNFP